MASMPPATKFSGPPPGATPQGITSMVPPGRLEEDESTATNPPGGGGGGLKDVFDEMSAVLDSLAGILPEYAEEIDSIKTQLSEVLAKAISGGASFTGDTKGEEMKSSSGFPA